MIALILEFLLLLGDLFGLVSGGDADHESRKVTSSGKSDSLKKKPKKKIG